MADTTRVQLAHGGGGQLTAEMIRDVILPALGDGGAQTADSLSDAAVLPADGSRKIAMTTDGYVVQPLEFPGGDIGKLAICGTVNDLAVAGAEPVALAMALVIEEGFEIATLRRLMESAGRAAADAGVKVVTGDTKVVERGGVAGMTITTSGVGLMRENAALGFGSIRPGDNIVLSGPLGEHGMAVMTRRKGLAISTELKSDCAAVSELAGALIESLGEAVKFMRDPTRGGLAATLADVAASTGCDVEIDESAIPMNRMALSAAEMLGLDLLTVANEGKLVALVSPDSADEACAILKTFEIARDAAVIGAVGEPADSPLVEMVTAAGGRRVVQMPYGEELPRIC